MFARPEFFIGFISIPLFFIIYLLRNRYRSQIVSNIQFWRDTKHSCSGGRHINKINTTWLFIIELLILILLIFAAVSPMFSSPSIVHRFIVILDDSFSMLADNFENARSRSIKKIEEIIGNVGKFEVTFILGNSIPGILSSKATTLNKVRSTLDKWNCMSSRFNVNDSIALAMKIAGKTGRIIVLSDRKPAIIPNKGRLKWFAWGTPQGNTGFINAVQSTSSNIEKFLIQIVNHSSIRTVIEVNIPTGKKNIISKTFPVDSGKTHQFTIKIPKSSLPAKAIIKSEDSRIDNELWLVKRDNRTLRVKLNVTDEVLLEYLQRALKAMESVIIVKKSPHIVFTDQKIIGKPDLLTVLIKTGSQISGFVGPFISSAEHPICIGLQLQGIVWAASKDTFCPGIPLIMAGNIPLLTLQEKGNSEKNLFLNINCRKSTILKTVNWPILISNILEFRRQTLTGTDHAIYPLGSNVTLKTSSKHDKAVIINPDGTSEEILIHDSKINYTPDQKGIYKIEISKSEIYSFSINALNSKESDLRNSITGEWGAWNVSGMFWWQYKSIGWILLLISLLLLGLHRFISTRGEQT